MNLCRWFLLAERDRVLMETKKSHQFQRFLHCYFAQVNICGIVVDGE